MLQIKPTTPSNNPPELREDGADPRAPAVWSRRPEPLFILYLFVSAARLRSGHPQRLLLGVSGPKLRLFWRLGCGENKKQETQKMNLFRDKACFESALKLKLNVLRKDVNVSETERETDLAFGNGTRQPRTNRSAGEAPGTDGGSVSRCSESRVVPSQTDFNKL